MRKPCAAPAQSGCFFNPEVRRGVPFSSRPSPLSVVLAIFHGDTAGGSPSGGKSRGTPPRLLVVSQPGRYVYREARLVVLDDQHVVSFALDDLLTEVALAEHGVAGEDVTFDGQDARQL